MASGLHGGVSDDFAVARGRHPRCRAPARLAVDDLLVIAPYAMLLSALSASAWGQAVTLADLDGAFVELNLKSQVEGRRNGKAFTSQSEAVWKIVLGPGNTGFSSATTITHGDKGVRVSDPRRGSFTLGRPGSITSFGGGYYLWTFENGTLTFLRWRPKDPHFFHPQCRGPSLHRAIVLCPRSRNRER
jgi:hypothetical protein